MEVLKEIDLKRISGAMNLAGMKGSSNVVDLRGKNMGSWVDAANMLETRHFVHHYVPWRILHTWLSFLKSTI
jgi:hypothetical protein